MKNVTDGLNLDRSNWELVKFGDIAIQQKESVDRDNTELTRYVKGEHMYSEDLHLREWGELTDEYLGPAFIRKFEEGDILYGSRRTYLRKVTIAPFDGITSNTTFVIKANEKKIDARLLPFVMLSEGFSQHSIKNSKGSVNPYVNWKDLAGYEFLLPLIENQSDYVSFFLSLDQLIESHRLVCSKNMILKEIILKKLFDGMISDVCIGDVFDIVSGFPYKSKYFNEDGRGYKLMRGINIKEGCFLWTNQIDRYYDHSEGVDKKYITKMGDILIPMDGSKLGLNYAVVTEAESGCLLVQRIASLRSDNKYLNQLLVAFLSSVYFRDFIFQNNTTTAIPHISMNQLKSICLPRITIETESLLESLQQIDLTLSDSLKHIGALEQLNKKLINQVF